jgi:PIN domain nuclease of toxin-antitoxin system
VIVAVGDTHTIIWWLFDSSKLSVRALQFMRSATASSDKIAISSITLIEVVYLIEKGRIPLETLTAMAQIIRTPNGPFEEVPVSLHVARTLNEVDVAKVSDMPDRIIAATAVHLNVPVISKDGKIQLSGLATIW